MGRPKALTDELRTEVCERIAGGETVRQIAGAEHMPAASTIYLALGTDKAFSEQYAQAREAQLVRWEDELIEIADDGSNDLTTRKRGDDDVEVVDHDHIARSRIRIDTRKWLMSKRLPKKYGDRVAQEISGPEGGPVQVEMTDEERARRIAFILAKAQAARGARPDKTSDAQPEAMQKG